MVALLISIIKTTRLPDVLVLKVKNGDNEIVGFDVSGGEKLAKKLKKLSKSWKLSKSEKKPLKSGNSSKFGTKKAEPNFLISDAKKVFNCLWLAFTKS